MAGWARSTYRARAPRILRCTQEMLVGLRAVGESDIRRCSRETLVGTWWGPGADLVRLERGVRRCSREMLVVWRGGSGRTIRRCSREMLVAWRAAVGVPSGAVRRKCWYRGGGSCPNFKSRGLDGSDAVRPAPGCPARTNNYREHSRMAGGGVASSDQQFARTQQDGRQRDGRVGTNNFREHSTIRCLVGAGLVPGWNPQLARTQHDGAMVGARDRDRPRDRPPANQQLPRTERDAMSGSPWPTRSIAE